MSEAQDRQNAAEGADDCPEAPRLEIDVSTRATVVHTTTQAKLHFNRVVQYHRDWMAKEPGMSPYCRTHVARLERERDAAVATLRQMESAYAPVLALVEATDEASTVAFEALDAFLMVPCTSLADIKFKLSVVTLDRYIADVALEPVNYNDLLTSFAGVR